MYLESRSGSVKHFIIQSPVDSYIPFCEYFIVPYLLWFALMICVGLYFFLTDKKGFYKLIIFLYTGMTIFLIISTIFPNMQTLRPYSFARDNVFVDMVRQLYKTDTPTNVLPSIHVFNTLGILSAVKYSDAFKKHKAATGFVFVLSILIILATMFLKQHSVTDVVAAFALAAVMHVLVYVVQWQKSPKLANQPVN